MDHAVLLVDDNANLLAGLTRALRKQPFQIYTARNGEEAVWVLKTRNINVLVTDESIPGMCGADLAAWVADNCPQVMRIMLTGHADLKTAIRAINDLGVCRFFTKPCNEARLAVAIHKAIEQKDAQGAHREAFETRRRQLRELELRHQGFELQVRVRRRRPSRPAANPPRLLPALAGAIGGLARPRSSPAPDRRRQRREPVLRTCRPAKNHRLL